MTLVSPANPTAQITLMRPVHAPKNPAISIEVEDPDAVHALAAERGFNIVYPLTDEPWGVRRFFVEDPNGVIINIMAHQSTAQR